MTSTDYQQAAQKLRAFVSYSKYIRASRILERRESVRDLKDIYSDYWIGFLGVRLRAANDILINCVIC